MSRWQWLLLALPEMAAGTGTYFLLKYRLDSKWKILAKCMVTWMAVCTAAAGVIFQAASPFGNLIFWAMVLFLLADGLLEEAELVWRNREWYCTAAQAIGYKEFFPYFEQTQTLAECAARLKQATRRYAKRQLTWFRHQSDAVWLYVEDADLLERACGLIRNFLEE